MNIEFIAHATFAVDLSDGRRLIIDPYQGMSFQGRFNYPSYKTFCDFAVLTHEHLDHSWLGDLSGNPVVVRQAWQDSDLRISSFFAWHDKFQGTKFHGYVLMKCIEADGLRICHMGDVGEILSDAQISSLGRVDVLILPVGGFYSIDGDEAADIVRRVSPRVAIPCHYQTPLCSLPIDGPERFLRHYSDFHRESRHCVDPSQLPDGVVLLPDHFDSLRSMDL